MAEPVRTDAPVDFEDLRCVLNPVQAEDLIEILLRTPAKRRLAVACAFAGFETPFEAFVAAGLAQPNTGHGRVPAHQAWWRWVAKRTHFPLGAAFRISRLFGTPHEILLAWWLT